jgi:hypothetical protein
MFVFPLLDKVLTGALNIFDFFFNLLETDKIEDRAFQFSAIFAGFLENLLQFCLVRSGLSLFLSGSALAHENNHEKAAQSPYSFSHLLPGGRSPKEHPVPLNPYSMIELLFEREKAFLIGFIGFLALSLALS